MPKKLPPPRRKFQPVESPKYYQVKRRNKRSRFEIILILSQNGIGVDSAMGIRVRSLWGYGGCLCLHVVRNFRLGEAGFKASRGHVF